MVRLDFETRSELNVKDVGPHIYSKHPSTDVICMTWSIGDGPIKLWHPFSDGQGGIPKSLHNALFEKYSKLEAHNKMFEECVWQNVMVKKYGWPEIDNPDAAYECSAATAALMGLPRALDTLGKALKLKKQKDLEGKRVMLKLTKPRKPTKADPISKWHEGTEDLIKVFNYCKDDVASEREASQSIVPMPDIEHKIWTMDQRINRRGVYIDREAVESALYLMDWYQKEMCQELTGITGGLVQSPSQIKNIHEFLEERGCFIPNLQKQTVEEALSTEGAIQDPSARRVLEIRALLGKSSVTKYQSMLNRMDPDDDRVRDILVFAGASTGRWAGSGIQIQNLPAGRGVDNKDLLIDIIKERNLELLKLCYADPLMALSAAVRSAICAPDGRILRSIDYNAIEARVIFWLSNCKLGIDEFKDNKPIYRLMAAEIFGIEEPDVTEEHRDLGKRVVLGAGFGMGPDKFVITCKMQGNKIIEKALAVKAIQAYRNRYKEVPIFWRQLDEAAMKTVSAKVGFKTRVGKLIFTKHEKYMTITLPSGRHLYYWYPSIKEQETSWGTRDAVHFWYVDSQTRKWVEGPSYGGLWAENVTQACARDVMAVAMLAVEGAGHMPVFSVHDEIVLEDDTKFKSLKEAEQTMLNSLPKWAEGLPIVVKGWEGKRYKK